VEDVKHHKKESLIMKKFVFGFCILMLTLVMIGCPTDGNETKEPDNPYKGLTVAEQYWGTYVNKDDSTDKAHITAKSITHDFIDTNNNPGMRITIENPAYTVGADLMVYGYSYIDRVWGSNYWGYFEDNQTFHRGEYDENNSLIIFDTYIKQ
jgi:hypothetical protein